METCSLRQTRRVAPYSTRIRTLLSSAPGSGDPESAIVSRANELVRESGISEPPFDCRLYAQLRNVEQVIERQMSIDGRLVPSPTGFTIELRKDRPSTRKNFTCAHEVAHTFFYPCVQSTTCHNFMEVNQKPDQEEERLCDIAAAELVMPLNSIAKIAKDYAPSTKSLVDLASLFNTSLTATAIRLLRLGVWDVGLALWGFVNEGLKARWLCRRSGALSHHPTLSIMNEKSSSIFHTAKTGERATEWEYLLTDSGVWPCRIESMRINAYHVLTLIGANWQPTKIVAQPLQVNTELPIEYSCQCDGSGWRLIKKEGRIVAYRCRASQHSSDKQSIDYW